LRQEDLDLAGRCVSGDCTAQRELFRRERSRVQATLYRILGSNHDMEDLVQEAFIEIFRSLASFRGEARLGTWLDKITVRVACAYLSRRRPKVARLEAVPEIPDGDANAEERAMAREAARRAYTLLDRLDVHKRVAFSLHAIDGRPLAEVARLMDASLVATKVRVWRARREMERRADRDPVLRSFLEPEGGGAPASSARRGAGIHPPGGADA